MALNLAPRQVWAWLNDPATRKWTSITTVVAAAVTLSFVLVWTWTEAVHPSAAKCSNAPARVNKIPQLVDILACIVAFILGRITARPKIQSRRQLKDWTTGRANTHQLGQSLARAAVVTPAALTSVLFIFTFLFAFETINPREQRLADHLLAAVRQRGCALAQACRGVRILLSRRALAVVAQDA